MSVESCWVKGVFTGVTPFTQKLSTLIAIGRKIKSDYNGTVKLQRKLTIKTQQSHINNNINKTLIIDHNSILMSLSTITKVL